MSVITTPFLRERFARILDRMGVELKYYSKTVSSVDDYGNPSYTITEYNIRAITERLEMRDTRFVEAGYLPEHYLILYLAHDALPVINELADEVDVGGIRYLVRLKYNMMFGVDIIYVKLLLRRVQGV